MQFVENIRQQQGKQIRLVLSEDEHYRQAWYFVKIDRAKRQLFNKQVVKGGVDLEKYGEVIASGYGALPPRYVMDIMIHRRGYIPAS